MVVDCVRISQKSKDFFFWEYLKLILQIQMQKEVYINTLNVGN